MAKVNRGEHKETLSDGTTVDKQIDEALVEVLNRKELINTVKEFRASAQKHAEAANKFLQQRNLHVEQARAFILAADKIAERIGYKESEDGQPDSAATPPAGTEA